MSQKVRRWNPSTLGAVDGKPLPPRNTKVLIRDNRGEFTVERYVTSYHDGGVAHPSDTGLVVYRAPNSVHGAWVQEWVEPAAQKKSVIDGLSEKKKRRLAEEALAAANKLGYCAESKKVLTALGLPVKKTKTVTVDVWDDDEVKVKVNGKTVETNLR